MPAVDDSATACVTAASSAAALAVGANEELFLRLMRCVALAAPKELECAREMDWRAGTDDARESRCCVVGREMSYTMRLSMSESSVSRVMIGADDTFDAVMISGSS